MRHASPDAVAPYLLAEVAFCQILVLRCVGLSPGLFPARWEGARIVRRGLEMLLRFVRDPAIVWQWGYLIPPQTGMADPHLVTAGCFL